MAETTYPQVPQPTRRWALVWGMALATVLVAVIVVVGLSFAWHHSTTTTHAPAGSGVVCLKTKC